MSVDGVVESPNQWQFDHFDGELGTAMGRMIGSVDTAIFGRVGFQDWSDSWPHADSANPFAAFINPIEKFVASRTLSGDLGWNAKLIEGDVEAFLTELSRHPGVRSHSLRAFHLCASFCFRACSTS